MLAAFHRINLPNFYKLDKTMYTRGDISEIGNKLGKKLDDLEACIDYERKKNQAAVKAQNGLQSQINTLVLQLQ